MKPKSELILYQTEDNRTRIEVRLENETVWLTQAQMAELFQTTIPNVSMHIRNILAEGELQAGSVVKEFLTTAADGKNYTTKFHNLDFPHRRNRPRRTARRPSGRRCRSWKARSPTRGAPSPCRGSGRRTRGDSWRLSPRLPGRSSGT